MTGRQVNEAAEMLGVLANAMRIRMVHIMLEGELQVGDLANRVSLSSSATSQHLRRFKMAGLLVQRKDEQSRYCTIAPDKVDILQRMISIAEAHQVNQPGNIPRP
ncbi:metalloregulator ArsR/SmtB family transcription factor [Rhizobium sp. NFR03]|uniref:ArsR/SmtB family transcription factor n=1 Tax=Rhizobium sp. NFR03 TaxID=1566263 RepID=UPI00111491F2|nr:metalloregulator ArsR/SmtB family transcription factor [Rhizobium sp. NFR03]